MALRDYAILVSTGDAWPLRIERHGVSDYRARVLDPATQYPRDLGPDQRGDYADHVRPGDWRDFGGDYTEAGAASRAVAWVAAQVYPAFVRAVLVPGQVLRGELYEALDAALTAERESFAKYRLEAAQHTNTRHYAHGLEGQLREALARLEGAADTIADLTKERDSLRQAVALSTKGVA